MVVQCGQLATARATRGQGLGANEGGLYSPEGRPSKPQFVEARLWARSSPRIAHAQPNAMILRH